MFLQSSYIAILIALNIIISESNLVQFQIEPIVVSKFEIGYIRSISKVEWIDFTIRGSESNKQVQSLESNLVAANIFVQNGTLSHIQLLDTLPSIDTQRNSVVVDEILKSSLYVYNTKCAPEGILGDHCAKILSDIGLPQGTELADKCQDIINNRNDRHNYFSRLLPRHYEDGFHKMFTNGLPQPLEISRTFEKISAGEKSHILNDFRRNIALVQWSQFVANDLNKPVVKTMRNGSPIECCNVQNYRLSPRYQHPACKPLIIKDSVNHHSPARCLNYVRSALAVKDKCTFAAPEQVNQATAKLDLSQLYGYNINSQQRMRLYRKGLLKSTNFGKLLDSLLPMAAEYKHQFCALTSADDSNKPCFMSGDSRVNSDPFAIIIHTIMLRNHNRIAIDLYLLHPNWEDEQLFQRAKSININIYRRIVFNEWLPVILGSSMTNEIHMIGRKISNSVNINNNSHYQIYNEYAVAASRFYLSMMPNTIRNFDISAGYEITKNESFYNNDNNIFILQDEIYSPKMEYTSIKLDKILYSLLMQKAMKMDASYVESLTSDLGNNKRPSRSDLLAFDIQRGRDHGLQPYYKYLEICNNIKINVWNDLLKYITPKNLNLLKIVYASWRDIDLIVGGISEIMATNATVGPTFQCVIGKQFLNLRQWHQIDFSTDDSDLSKWETITAADLLCLNTNVLKVPLNIFTIFSQVNPMVDCIERRKNI